VKSIIKTKGAFELYDPTTREHVQQRPRVVTWTQFFEARTGAGQIVVMESGLPDAANDTDFQGYLKESTTEELAAASYASSFNEAAPTERELLEMKARELGLDFRSNISDSKLAERVAAAEGE
jgi:hypothetical protein